MHTPKGSRIPGFVFKLMAAALGLLVAPFLRSASPPLTALDGRPLDTSPSIAGLGKGHYPEELERRNKLFSGLVKVKFVVTAEGKMKDPQVLQNSHWAFVPPTIAQLYACIYTPGTIGG